MNNTDTATLEPAVIDDAKLEIMPRADGIERFRPIAAQLAEAKARVSSLEIQDSDSEAEQARKMKEARRMRLDIFKAARLQAKKLHTEMKAGILDITRKLDGAEREIRQDCEQYEDQLEEIEKHAERIAEQRRTALRQQRAVAISPFLTGPLAHDLADLTEEQFAQQLADAKELHEMRLERARKEQEERERREAAERAERERIEREREEERKRLAAEAERLRKEAAEREAAAKAERERIEAENRKRMAEMQAKLDAERKAAEQARKAAEAERARLAAIEAEKAKAERERIEAERRAAAAPDADKLRAYIAAIEAIPAPVLSNGSAVTQKAVAALRAQFVAGIRKAADSLTA